VKFVHAADLHLDSPLTGLERYEGAPAEQIRRASRRALSNLVDLCIGEGAALLVIAGDVFDGDWRDYATGLFFASQMARLQQADVRVVWIRGNHDAACRVTKHLVLPGVHELPCDTPGSVVFEELGVAVHGQGFATQAVTRDLSAAYPEPVAGAFNIGLLHTALDGIEGHAPYAPCKAEALVNKGYEYWALGHVHQHTVVTREPWLVFPGNLQGRNVRETGAKGAVLVTLEHGRLQSLEHRALDVARYAVCRIDAAGASSTDEVVERVLRQLESEASACEGRLLAARIILEGSTRAHRALVAEQEQVREQIRSAAMYLRDGQVWIEKVLFATRAELDFAALSARDDAIGELSQALVDLRASPEQLEALFAELGDLKHRLPSELGRELERSLFADVTAQRRVVDDVEQLLLPRLLAGEDG
jgi:DNA repair protein SbcD/Mre11